MKKIHFEQLILVDEKDFKMFVKSLVLEGSILIVNQLVSMGNQLQDDVKCLASCVHLKRKLLWFV